MLAAATDSNEIRPAAIRGSLYHSDGVLSTPAAPTKEFSNASALQHHLATATLHTVGTTVSRIHLRGDLLIRHTRGLVRARHHHWRERERQRRQSSGQRAG